AGREAAIAKFKATAPPPDPKFELLFSMALQWWPGISFTMPTFRSIQPHKLIDSPDIDTGHMLLVMVMSATSPFPLSSQLPFLPQTNLLSFRQGHLPGSTDGSELVVWLSGHKMDSSLAQRIHAAELLEVDPRAIIQMFNQ
ncbi:hypothetical protein BS47DRAFT_1353859, partial [Hydnum rufescens UP504]